MACKYQLQFASYSACMPLKTTKSYKHRDLIVQQLHCKAYLFNTMSVIPQMHTLLLGMFNIHSSMGTSYLCPQTACSWCCTSTQVTKSNDSIYWAILFNVISNVFMKDALCGISCLEYDAIDKCLLLRSVVFKVVSVIPIVGSVAILLNKICNTSLTSEWKLYWIIKRDLKSGETRLDTWTNACVHEPLHEHWIVHMYNYVVECRK